MKPSSKFGGTATGFYRYAGFYWNNGDSFDDAIKFTLDNTGLDWNNILSEDNCPELGKRLREMFADGMPKFQSGFAMGFEMGYDESGAYKIYCSTIDEKWIVQVGDYKGMSVDDFIEMTFAKVEEVE